MKLQECYYYVGTAYLHRGGRSWCHRTRTAAEKEAANRDRPTCVFRVFGKALRSIDDVDQVLVGVKYFELVKRFTGWRKYSNGAFAGSTSHDS